MPPATGSRGSRRVAVLENMAYVCVCVCVYIWVGPFGWKASVSDTIMPWAAVGGMGRNQPMTQCKVQKQSHGQSAVTGM